MPHSCLQVTDGTIWPLYRGVLLVVFRRKYFEIPLSVPIDTVSPSLSASAIPDVNQLVLERLKLLYTELSIIIFSESWRCI